jgi:DNA polymerase I-like protein with 3'-5' exonuclease and polymerase domains
MRILVNFDKAEQGYLSVLQYHLKQRHIEAVATTSNLTLGELLGKAEGAKCDGILLCNPTTLAACVPGDKPSLDLYRGSRLRFSTPTVVCNSLAHVHTLDHGSWLLGSDLDKFSKLKTTVPFAFTILEFTSDFDECFSFLSSCALIAYDIETTTVGEDEESNQAGDTLITCASWSGITGKGELRTFVLPLIDFHENHWHSMDAYAEALLFLRKVNALDVPKVMHNGMYDATHSLCYRAPPRNWVLDTMALAHAQYVSLPKTLDFVASITLPDYVQWKTQAADAQAKKDIRSYWEYNAKDTWYTLRIALHYIYNLPAYARKNFQIQFPLVYPFLYASFEGIKIDEPARVEKRAKHEEKMATSLERIRKMVGNADFNPSSPKQVAFYVYDVFGAADPHVGKKKDAKTGVKSKKERGTDEKNLKAVGQQHPILLRLTSAIITYREARKAVGTYFDFLQKNGRLLWNINPFGTETGRASASSSHWWCGTQVQNIPPYAKEFLIADEGYELIEADNSQSEARCTAYLAKETGLITALETPGKDFYKTLGFLFFGIPYDQVTKDFRNDILKKIVHGTNYMMGAVTFIENAGAEKLIGASSTLGIRITMMAKPLSGELTLKQYADTLLESYHKPFPRVRAWYAEVKHEIATTHTLVSPLGWTRYFFGDILKKHQIFASAVAHGPQNLSVMILNKGVWKVWTMTKASNGAIRFKAQIHDSIFQQVRKDLKAEFVPKLLNAMDNPVVVHGRTLRIPVDYKDGTCWGSLIEHKN